MMEAAERLDFEQAAVLRDKITEIRKGVKKKAKNARVQGVK